MISLIAAVDEQGGIGKNNQLLCHLSADLRYFKKMTLSKPVIMGRKTFESIGKLLPERTNIIVTHQKLKIPGAYICSNIEQAIKIAGEASEIMVIGGASIYQQTLPLASKLYLTLIHHTFDADVFFPKIDAMKWKCVDRIFYPKDNKNMFDMTFCIYKRI